MWGNPFKYLDLRLLFGLVIALGMLLGMGFVILEASAAAENKDDYLEMMIMSLLLGVVGSRMLYVLCSWNLYKGQYY